MQNILTSPLADDTTYYSLGPVHTYPDIFKSTTFLSRCGFHPHVSGESGTQMCKFFNPLSRVEIFEIHFEIFESAKKNWRIEKYSDTCGRGAKACWQVELPK